MSSFDADFETLTGHVPFPWQRRLFDLAIRRRGPGQRDHAPFPWQRRLFDEWLSIGKLPSAVDIPTGLGKTAVMAVWLLARARGAALPRRLVYVVDRRAVVDQATDFAERLRGKLKCSELERVREGLGLHDRSLPISTLRGRHADNREWLEDPAAPAIIVGTVDMIGSRLLFSGYGVSRRMRPYAAGLMGCDTLVVLDEAHLVPPFEELLRTIAQGSHEFGPRGEMGRDIVPRFRLLSLSATGRTENLAAKGCEGAGDGVPETFRLCRHCGDHDNEVVRERLSARKRLTIHVRDDPGDLIRESVERAWRLGAEREPARVIVYCDRRTDAEKVKRGIDKKGDAVSELLVGSRRVRERERLVCWLSEHGFLGDSEALPTRPTFLVATSAGEVGIDLDADHMVCDLVAWERMVQRLGRVNRRGKGDARIEVVAVPTTVKRKKDGEAAAKWEDEWRMRLARLRGPLDSLRGISEENFRDASPGGILDLNERAGNQEELRCKIKAATSPEPLRPELTRALVDSWSLTSLSEHTGRPEVGPWLRGWEKDQSPQTTIVWRCHLPVRQIPQETTKKETTKKEIEMFFGAAPPHATEMLETETHHVVDWLAKCVDSRFDSERKAASDTTSDEASDDASAGFTPLRDEDVMAYVLSPTRDRRATLKKDQAKEKEWLKNRMLPGATLIVDARLGGLSLDGMLDPKIMEPARAMDDGDEWLPRSDDKPVVGFRVRERSIGERGSDGEEDWREGLTFVIERTEEGEPKRQLVVEKWRHHAEREDNRSVGRLQTLAEHQAQTERKARCLGKRIGLREPYTNMLAIAARLHDEGKRHGRWQRAIVAPPKDGPYAKGRMRPGQLNGYRHEFGSLAYAVKDPSLGVLPPDMKDLALHLIAAHHGWSRPMISTAGGDAPPSFLASRARDVALRFVRLQRQWGPWGLAWWEALLRAADQQASRENDKAKGKTR